MALEASLKVAADSGGADSLPVDQLAAVDAMQGQVEDHTAENLAGTLSGRDAGKSLAELPAAAQS